MGTESRRCERCNGAVPGRMSRSRDEAGLLVCEECIKMKTPDWTAGLKYVAAMGEGPEMERRVSEAISSIARVARAKRVGLTVTAHDSGDNAIINHCPFCGSGAVVGKGTGTVGCEFCHTNFTVQVQPAHPFMPQTVDGQPVPPAGLPGDEPTEMSAPLDPAVNEVEEGVGVAEEATNATPFNAPAADKPEEPKKENPFSKGSAKASYRTSDGHTLDEDAYIARLALAYADDREDVLDSVRTAHVTKQAAGATVTCPRCAGYGNEPDGTDLPCSSCSGTGLVWVKVPGVTASDEDPKSAVYVLTVEGQDGFHPTIQWDESFGKWTCTGPQGRYGTANSPQRLLTTMKARFGPTTMAKQGAKQADLLNPASHIDDDEHDLLATNHTDWDEDLLWGNRDYVAPVPPDVPPWLREDERGGFRP